MNIYTEILGNVNLSEEWRDLLKDCQVDDIFLDQWTAQKSRFLATGVSGHEYPVALARHTQIVDGDIIAYNPEEKSAVVLRLELNPVLVIDLAGISDRDTDTIIRTSLELGHAIGNQHWPAVVKGTKVYVPLTVDRKVMLSVMETHNIPGITYEFMKGQEVIPYMAPHEIRRLFGGASHESHGHAHVHSHGGVFHTHAHDHLTSDHHDHEHDHHHEHHDHEHHHE